MLERRIRTGELKTTGLLEDIKLRENSRVLGLMLGALRNHDQHRRYANSTRIFIGVTKRAVRGLKAMRTYAIKSPWPEYRMIFRPSCVDEKYEGGTVISALLVCRPFEEQEMLLDRNTVIQASLVLPRNMGIDEVRDELVVGYYKVFNGLNMVPQYPVLSDELR